jgi:hypothetical protein
MSMLVATATGKLDQAIQFVYNTTPYFEPTVVLGKFGEIRNQD